MSKPYCESNNHKTWRLDPIWTDSFASKRLKDSQMTLNVVRRDLSALSEHEVPALIKDNAASQLTKILQGDYDLKIARQDYFTSNQDQVLMINKSCCNLPCGCKAQSPVVYIQYLIVCTTCLSTVYWMYECLSRWSGSWLYSGQGVSF